MSDSAWIYGDKPAVHARPQGISAFGSMLPGRTVWELVSYIKSLAEIEDPAAALGFDPNYGRFRAAAGAEDENDQADQ